MKNLIHLMLKLFPDFTKQANPVKLLRRRFTTIKHLLLSLTFWQLVYLTRDKVIFLILIIFIIPGLFLKFIRIFFIRLIRYWYWFYWHCRLFILRLFYNKEFLWWMFALALGIYNYVFSDPWYYFEEIMKYSYRYFPTFCLTLDHMVLTYFQWFTQLHSAKAISWYISSCYDKYYLHFYHDVLDFYYRKLIHYIRFYITVKNHETYNHYMQKYYYFENLCTEIFFTFIMLWKQFLNYFHLTHFVSRTLNNIFLIYDFIVEVTYFYFLNKNFTAFCEFYFLKFISFLLFLYNFLFLTEFSLDKLGVWLFNFYKDSGFYGGKNSFIYLKIYKAIDYFRRDTGLNGWDANHKATRASNFFTSYTNNCACESINSFVWQQLDGLFYFIILCLFLILLFFISIIIEKVSPALDKWLWSSKDGDFFFKNTYIRKERDILRIKLFHFWEDNALHRIYAFALLVIGFLVTLIISNLIDFFSVMDNWVIPVSNYIDYTRDMRGDNKLAFDETRFYKNFRHNANYLESVSKPIFDFDRYTRSLVPPIKNEMPTSTGGAKFKKFTRSLEYCLSKTSRALDLFGANFTSYPSRLKYSDYVANMSRLNNNTLTPAQGFFFNFQAKPSTTSTYLPIFETLYGSPDSWEARVDWKSKSWAIGGPTDNYSSIYFSQLMHEMYAEIFGHVQGNCYSMLPESRFSDLYDYTVELNTSLLGNNVAMLNNLLDHDGYARNSLFRVNDNTKPFLFKVGVEKRYNITSFVDSARSKMWNKAAIDKHFVLSRFKRIFNYFYPKRRFLWASKELNRFERQATKLNPWSIADIEFRHRRFSLLNSPIFTHKGFMPLNYLFLNSANESLIRFNGIALDNKIPPRYLPDDGEILKVKGKKYKSGRKRDMVRTYKMDFRNIRQPSREEKKFVVHKIRRKWGHGFPFDNNSLYGTFTLTGSIYNDPSWRNPYYIKNIYEPIELLHDEVSVILKSPIMHEYKWAFTAKSKDEREKEQIAELSMSDEEKKWAVRVPDRHWIYHLPERLVPEIENSESEYFTFGTEDNFVRRSKGLSMEKRITKIHTPSVKKVKLSIPMNTTNRGSSLVTPTRLYKPSIDFSDVPPRAFGDFLRHGVVGTNPNVVDVGLEATVHPEYNFIREYLEGCRSHIYRFVPRNLSLLAISPFTEVDDAYYPETFGFRGWVSRFQVAFFDVSSMQQLPLERGKVFHTKHRFTIGSLTKAFEWDRPKDGRMLLYAKRKTSGSYLDPSSASSWLNLSKFNNFYSLDHKNPSIIQKLSPLFDSQILAFKKGFIGARVFHEQHFGFKLGEKDLSWDLFTRKSVRFAKNNKLPVSFRFEEKCDVTKNLKSNPNLNLSQLLILNEINNADWRRFSQRALVFKNNIFTLPSYEKHKKLIFTNNTIMQTAKFNHLAAMDEKGKIRGGFFRKYKDTEIAECWNGLRRRDYIKIRAKYKKYLDKLTKDWGGLTLAKEAKFRENYFRYLDFLLRKKNFDLHNKSFFDLKTVFNNQEFKNLYYTLKKDDTWNFIKKYRLHDYFYYSRMSKKPLELSHRNFSSRARIYDYLTYSYRREVNINIGEHTVSSIINFFKVRNKFFFRDYNMKSENRYSYTYSNRSIPKRRLFNLFQSRAIYNMTKYNGKNLLRLNNKNYTFSPKLEFINFNNKRRNLENLENFISSAGKFDSYYKTCKSKDFKTIILNKKIELRKSLTDSSSNALNDLTFFLDKEKKLRRSFKNTLSPDYIVNYGLKNKKMQLIRESINRRDDFLKLENTTFFDRIWYRVEFWSIRGNLMFNEWFGKFSSFLFSIITSNKISFPNFINIRFFLLKKFYLYHHKFYVQDPFWDHMYKDFLLENSEQQKKNPEIVKRRLIKYRPLLVDQHLSNRRLRNIFKNQAVNDRSVIDKVNYWGKTVVPKNKGFLSLKK